MPGFQCRAELKSLLVMPAELDILSAKGGAVVRYDVVTCVQALPSNGGFAHYGLTIEPPFSLLQHRRTSRVFRGQAQSKS